MISRLVLVLACLPLAFAALGVDISQLASETVFTCLKKAGYDFVVVRCYEQVGRIDPNCAASMKNAKAAGFETVDAYIFPCTKCTNPGEQVNTTLKFLKDQKLDDATLWFDIEGPQYWGTQANNRVFFSEMPKAGKESGAKLGVYSSASQWNPIFGSYTGGSSLPLWYAHYDGVKSFADFSPFGGWTKPSIKQYDGDKTVCDMGVDLNFS